MDDKWRISRVRDQRRIWKQSTEEKTSDIAEFRAAALKDYRGYMRRHLKIVNFDAEEVYLEPNWSQLQIFDRMDAQEKAGKPVRCIVHKSRRVGSSTGCGGRLFSKTINANNTKSIVMAHLKEVAQSMFETYQLFQNRLPPELKIPLKRSNQRELIWQVINSQIVVQTAGVIHSTRSKNINHALCSEAAFYDDLPGVRGALEATVPKRPNTSLVWESTAYGAGTDWHKFWQESWAKQNSYEAIFLEWYKDPECQLPPFVSDAHQDEFIGRLFEKFPDLIERQKAFKLTPRQIAWYGNTLRENYSGNELWMQQEFPCTPDEGFLASGTPIFPQTLFEKYKHATTGFKGQRYSVHGGFNSLSELTKDQTLEPNKDNYLEIWIPPQDKRHYLVTADPAAGLLPGKGDYSACYVFDICTQNIVAELHGRFDLKLFATLLKSLAKQYNEAVIMPETNGLGIGLLAHLKEGYYNIYQERLDDGYAIKLTNRLGWETTEAKKLKMMSTARMLFVERSTPDPKLLIPSRALIDEICTFTQANLNGKGKSHDDRVIAWAMGVQGCFDELATRPDLAATIATGTTNGNKEKEEPNFTPDDIIRMVRSPLWVPGQPFDEDALVTGPFIPYGEDDYDE